MVADPPEVTVGDAELTVGVDVTSRRCSLDEVMAADEGDGRTAAHDGRGAAEVGGTDAPSPCVPALVPVLLDPAWPWDTATPMATVAPVAASTAPRVRLRSRARALSLLWGVGG